MYLWTTSYVWLTALDYLYTLPRAAFGLWCSLFWHCVEWLDTATKASEGTATSFRIKSESFKTLVATYQIKLHQWPLNPQTIKAKQLLYIPPGFTFSNSTFCSHTVCMYYLWIWEQTAIISLNTIDWLVFIMEMECVYCEVWTGYDK